MVVLSVKDVKVHCYQSQKVFRGAVLPGAPEITDGTNP